MFTTGGLMLGYWLTGSVPMEMAPTSTMMSEITMAVTGRRIKTSEIMGA